MECDYPFPNWQLGDNLIYIMSQMKLILNKFFPKENYFHAFFPIDFIV